VTDSHFARSEEADRPDDRRTRGEAWLTYKNYEQQGRSYSFFMASDFCRQRLWRFYEYPDKEARELTKQRD